MITSWRQRSNASRTLKNNKETNNLSVLPSLVEKFILNNFEEQRELRVLNCMQVFLN